MDQNPVVTSDLEVRWRPLSDTERASAQALLDDAWAVLATLAPNVTAGDLAESVVRSVICSAALRVLRNPEGNKSETIDDYSWTRDTSVSTGALYFSDAELELVRGVRPKAKSVTYWTGIY